MDKNVKHMILTDLMHQNMEPASNFMMLIKFSSFSSLISEMRTILKDLEAAFLVSLVIKMAKRVPVLEGLEGLAMTMISSKDLEVVDLEIVDLVHFHPHHLEVECLA